LDEYEVFAYLKKQKKAVLLEYLQAAFDTMTAKQRRAVFAGAARQAAIAAVDGDLLQGEIEEFRRASLAGDYYAPFNVNSKNFMDVPEATEEWCDEFARFVTQASRLTARGDHAHAVACFALLYELLEAVDEGREIIFAEEAGSWMIPAEEKDWLKAYLTSLAATPTPEAFTAAAILMLERDSHHSFASGVYAAALKVATPEQKANLQAEVSRRKIRTGQTP
jgi:hypothetical protein